MPGVDPGARGAQGSPVSTKTSVRTGYRYRPERLGSRYDALVVGSGIGGLTAAALLAALGRRVAVLEQHYTAGGATHSFERAGYDWDVGLHYVGDMGARTTLRRMMDFLTMGRLEWAPMDAHYERFFIGARVVDAVAGRTAFRDNLLVHFPREGAAVDRYLALVDQVARGMRAFSMERTLPPWLALLARPWLRRQQPPGLARSTWDVLAQLTAERDLIAVLTGQWGDYGLPPRRSSFVVHAMVARHYLNGGHYPVGGAWRIAECALPRIRAAGGEVFTYARVERILAPGGRVRGVRMADGHEIDCDCVISDAGAANTFGRLLPPEVARAHGLDRLLAQLQPSLGHLCVYIGLEAAAVELGLPKTNFWIYPDNDSDAALARFLADPSGEFPVVYISFPSAKDPDFERRRPGRATIEIIAPVPWSLFAPWAGTTWGRRGADYDALKNAYGERLLEHLYAKLPQLRGRVAYHEVSTPLSMQWFCGAPHGELYGLEHGVARMQARWLRPRTPLAGLWLTGQDIVSCGIGGAMMGGLATALAVAGTRRMMPVMKQIFG
ncbi:MAG: NAD(P)/FAD-dependent oxidoreductase [Comamonadaceae bacterium]|nr:NAD(P)/FAD-dependent oxidoreductase [Comamonadaceae bacterium]